jgi:hypothetical protein
MSSKKTGDALVESFKPIRAEIDLSANKLIKFIKLDKGEVRKSYAPDPKATLWFNDGFIVLNILGTTFNHTKYNTSPQKFSTNICWND